MENLVRRLGRIFSTPKETLPEPADNPEMELLLLRMDRLDASLQEWVRQQGWRSRDRTLSETAGALNTDTVTLYHYFQERMGMDFRTWRTLLRLEDAKRLLLEEPALSAADAGRKAGFSNRSNFSRQFVAYTGSTPARWRKEARGKTNV